MKGKKQQTKQAEKPAEKEKEKSPAKGKEDQKKSNSKSKTNPKEENKDTTKNKGSKSPLPKTENQEKPKQPKYKLDFIYRREKYTLKNLQENYLVSKMKKLIAKELNVDIKTDNRGQKRIIKRAKYNKSQYQSEFSLQSSM